MTSAEEPGTPKKRIAGLFGLSLLWALSALRSDLFPNWFQPTQGASDFAQQAITLGLFAVVSVAFALLSRRIRSSLSQIGNAMLVGLGLFFLPGLVFHFARTQVSDFTRVTVLSLVPVLVVVFEPHLRRLAPGNSSAPMVASLVAVAGTMCVFPFDLPSDFPAAVAFGAVVGAALSIALANCWGVRILQDDDQPSAVFVASIATGTAAAGFALASLIGSQSLNDLHSLSVAAGSVPSLLWTFIVDLPALGLLFYLLRSMPATATATRFLLAPLFANLIGLALLRPHVNLRAGLGLAMIAGGACWLVFMRASLAESESLSLHRDASPPDK